MSDLNCDDKSRHASSMSAPNDSYQYSTLEVATDADLVRQGQYPEVVPTQAPEAYGYYDPQKPEQQYAQAAHNTQNAQIPPSTTPNTYSTYPEVVDHSATLQPAASGSREAKICGLRRKYFWIALAAAILVIIGIVVGVPAGVVSSRSAHDKDGNGSGSGSGGRGGGRGGGGGENVNNGTVPVTLLENTRLASANFTDMYGNDNFLLAYQLNDTSILMSAFNTSNNKWIVSTVVNGTGGDVKLGTALAIDTFWEGTASPDVTLYYQTDGPTTTIKSVTYSSRFNLSTTSVSPPDNWKPVAAASAFNSLPGSSLATYGKQCGFCNQYTYFYWQGQQGIFSAENSGNGFKSAEVIDVDMNPSANTSMALAHSGTLTGDGSAILRRSINLFYRSTTSGLTQLRIGNGMNVPRYVGRDIGPKTNLAVFSTGFNESDSDNPTPIGFQVLSIDPDGNDGVQLTYLKGNDWTAATDEVTDLADCQAKATMATNIGRRLYCLVDSDDDAGVQIMEWAWQGDPSDTNTYLDWKKIGAVNVGV
ncbi:hypothetical protein HD806DRAFT_464061 [Xylariaceae sp. AK1471]|nr:hypothetical protein HD806DRAFT_464061 [Xylariaceae sp. AK1471]